MLKALRKSIRKTLINLIFLLKVGLLILNNPEYASFIKGLDSRNNAAEEAIYHASEFYKQGFSAIFSQE